MSAPITTRELLARLERHYIKPGQPLPGGIFLPECGWNGGGAGGCDAIYVGFTSTSGRILVGHELKVSRADWLNELNKPGKSDPWADQCHEWWLVVSDPAIVHDGELPAGWGLMTPGPSKTRMKIITKPARKDPTIHVPSWRAVRSIMARQDTLRAEAILAGRRRAEEAAQALVREDVEREVARQQGITPEVEHARALVKAIYDRHRRVPLDAEGLADAVCEVLDGRKLISDLRHLTECRLRSIKEATAELKSSWQYKALARTLSETAEAVS